MKKWSIGKKLFLATGLLSALIAGLGVMSLLSLGRIQGNMETAAGDLTERNRLASEIHDSSQEAFLAAKTSLLAALTNDPGRKLEFRQTELDDLAEVAGQIEKVPALQQDSSRQALERIRANRSLWLQLIPGINRMIDEGRVADAQRLSLKEVRPLYEAMNKDADLILSDGRKSMTDLRAAGEQT